MLWWTYPSDHHQLRRKGALACESERLNPIRNELVIQTIQAYQTLYESSIAFGMRRALQAEQKRKDMENKINTLKTTTRDLESQVNELEAKISEMEIADKEQQEQDKQNHLNNIEAQKRTNNILKEEL